MQKFGLVFHWPLNGFFGRCQKLVAHFALPSAMAYGYSSIMDDCPLVCPVPMRGFSIFSYPAGRKKPFLKIDGRPPPKSRLLSI